MRVGWNNKTAKRRTFGHTNSIACPSSFYFWREGTSLLFFFDTQQYYFQEKIIIIIIMKYNYNYIINMHSI